VFSTNKSFIRDKYLRHLPTWIKNLPIVEEEWNPLPLIDGHFRPVIAVAFSPNCALLASGLSDKTIMLWDLTIGTSHDSILRYNGPVRALAFSLDGKLLASGSDDKTVRLWDPMNGVPLGDLISHNGEVTALAFSSYGHHLASGSLPSAVRL
jgi:WD40 repeat protein